MNDDVTTEMVRAADGVELAVHRMGRGRPVVLLHGLFSNAETNWIKYGHAARIAAAGFELFMPDLRAHGHSAAPHEAEHYPDDILAQDLEALIRHFGLTDYDLGGFSLGARTVTRGVVRGLRPRRLILAGMGLEGLAGWARRRDFFLRVIDRFDEARRGEPEWMAIQFLKTTGADRIAMPHLLGSLTDTETPDLAALSMPTLVVCGDADQDNGSAPRLAVTLPDAEYVEIPGTHMSSVTQPELGAAIADFLSA